MLKATLNPAAAPKTYVRDLKPGQVGIFVNEPYEGILVIKAGKPDYPNLLIGAPYDKGQGGFNAVSDNCITELRILQSGDTLNLVVS